MESSDVRESCTESSPPAREEGWKRRLSALTFGLLIAETVTGLTILWLPFSLTTQMHVIVHTVVGLVFIVPASVYLWQHWRRYRDVRMTQVKLSGYLGLAVFAVLAVSGVVLTAQAVWGRRISHAWDLVHVVGTFALLAAVLPHVVTLLLRNRVGSTELAARVRRAGRRFLTASTGWAVLGVAPVLVLVVLYTPLELDNTLPEDYSLIYGEDRPFAPSLARTNTNDAFDPRTMSGSQSCGTAGCHEEIVEEWQVSAHRWAAMDPGFRTIQATMGAQNGPESTRYCAGCHDPISLFGGTKNLFNDELTNPEGLDEGISCITCHSIQETDVQGNANYVIGQPERYAYELRPEGRGRLVRDFLIRAYPDQHVETFSRRLFKSPDYCAACHKQFIDEEINQVGWVQLQNQFDNWRKSRWNEPGKPEETIECRECHMPLTDSRDPAAGDETDYNRTASDGKHRSHRFLGANQFIPTLLDLPGADEQVELTHQWLRGEIDIPEIAHKWREGPVIPIEIEAPDRVRPGSPVEIRTRLVNNKAGHEFPTGPLDIIQAWVEIEVTDQEGRVVFTSGMRDERNFIDPGSFLFKAEPVDRYGNLVDRHNLWEMVGVRYRRSLFPGFSDEAEFAFVCPSSSFSPDAVNLPFEDGMVQMDVPGEYRVERLDVTARLMYRKFDQYLLNFLEGGESELSAPVTVMSEDRTSITVTVPGPEQ
ncbi:MAG: multiheme c-type cytochrome [Longimicrobiales bacterium]|nr:multiheme c-type cytochrome [Longimicrobiales bacterium]